MKKELIEYLIRNKKNFIIIGILFVIGIAIGTFSVNNSDESQKQELNTYITNLIKKIKESDKNSIDNLELLMLSIKENATIILIIWFLGCTIIGGIFIYLAIIYKGFSIGYTISAMLAVLGTKQGIIISIVSLLLQNVIFLPAFFIIAENRNKII
ncbi:MAG: stage II sporulation protein M [Clostridia bacterium]|nr:stage II sporulation protein M [Clostridia bacterium]